MIVVSDTSPIINLAIIGELELLRKLYQEIIIPSSVFQEIAVEGSGQPGSGVIANFSWVKVEKTSDQNFVDALKLELDEGEAEAIALSIQLNADLLLIDERKGRKISSNFGIRYIGLLGCLVDAKQRNLIPEIKPLLDSLINKGGFWISNKLYQHILKSVGESGL